MNAVPKIMFHWPEIPAPPPPCQPVVIRVVTGRRAGRPAGNCGLCCDRYLPRGAVFPRNNCRCAKRRAGRVGWENLADMPWTSACPMPGTKAGLDCVVTPKSAWTELEARLKCQKRELYEWSATQALVPISFASQTMLLPDRRVVTVAIISIPSAGVEMQSHAVRAH